eukprot:824709_1
MAQEKFAKVKNWFDDAKKKLNQRITMEGILKQARESFEYFLESRSAFDVEKKISDKLMRDAYGIVLLTEVKVGVLAGGKVGTGVIIARVEDKDNEWSAPIGIIHLIVTICVNSDGLIAIGTGGLSMGFQAGVSKVDHIIILPSLNHVKSFLGLSCVRY